MMTDHPQTRRGALFLAAGFALASLLVSASAVLAHQEGGDPLTDDQQKCSNGAIKDWNKSSKTVNKEVQACVKNYGKGKPLDKANPAIDTLEECLLNDPKGKVQKQKDKTSGNFDKNCGGPNRDGIDGEGFPQMPPEYGATDPVTVSASAGQQQRDIAHDIFGEDLDAGAMAVASGPGDSGDAAKCQQRVVKSISKCMAEREKQFLKCTKVHLADAGIYGLIYDTDDMVLCYDGMDPFKIQKKCAGVPGQGMQKDVQKCADTVTDRTLSELFPGCDVDDVASVTQCLDQAARCRFCQSANTAIGANRDCDLFDDGLDNDSCALCSVSVSYPSTMAAIQSVIFDSPTYGCTNNLCHGSFAPQGGLDLTDDPNTPQIESHAQLVNVAATGASPPLDRVKPGEQDLSFLYNKLAAGTLGGDPGGGSPMPTGGAPALTPEHLEAMKTWIRGGAPEDLTVSGTALLLGSCLPEPDPLTIPVPDAPGAGVGVQLQQTPWPLPAQSEDEICMATYYDLTGTGLVPASAIVSCPVTTTNPSGQCFLYHKQSLYQDPQSHHSIIHIYLGDYPIGDPSWGPFTYKFQDGDGGGLHGTACDPTAVGPEGYNPGCSGPIESTIACVGFGAPDYSQAGGTAPSFSGSQEPYYEIEYADGVYSILPMQGIIVWNSHAFNLTNGDSTMSQYLNLDFAEPADQLYPAQGIFDSASIFVQDVPPFETREYCRTYTLPAGASLFQLGSHTHRWGVLWRTWAPPNTVCTPGQPACVPRGDTPLYLSTEYSDPLQLNFDPPVTHGTGGTQTDIENRTYLFCSLYDNESGPGSPSVKRQSTSPEPPLPVQLGGPCDDSDVACMAGPNKGALCNGSDAFCDTTPGAGDGICDACPVRGGVTTEDEMFILLGTYFVP